MTWVRLVNPTEPTIQVKTDGLIKWGEQVQILLRVPLRIEVLYNEEEGKLGLREVMASAEPLPSNTNQTVNSLAVDRDGGEYQVDAFDVLTEAGLLPEEKWEGAAEVILTPPPLGEEPAFGIVWVNIP